VAGSGIDRGPGASPGTDADADTDTPRYTRRVIHVDMDAFYASVEQRDDPSLRGRPVIVGGDPRGRGVVAACSYEARVFGVHSAMPAARALRLCPQAVVVRPDFARYVAASRHLRAIFHDYTPLVEPLSLDEAFLDVTDERGGLPTATAVAKAIRARVREELRLTASAGVAPVKFVAKIASDFRKPDGLTIVRPEDVRAFLEPLPVGKLWGVGPRTEERLHELGVRTVGALAQYPRALLVAALGESHGGHLHLLARGIDDRPVEPDRIAKQHGAERTFAEDVTERREMEALLREMAVEVAGSLAKEGRPGRTVTIKVRYPDFTTVSRSLTLPDPTDDRAILARTAVALLDRTEAGRRPVRLLGVSVGNLVEEGEPIQLPLPLGPAAEGDEDDA